MAKSSMSDGKVVGETLEMRWGLYAIYVVYNLLTVCFFNVHISLWFSTASQIWWCYM